MRNVRMTILVMVAVMIFGRICCATVYDFMPDTDGMMLNSCGFSFYLDGEYVDSGSLSQFAINPQLQFDVDATGMTTTLLQVHSQSNQPIQKQFTATKYGGLGEDDLTILFTGYLSSSSFGTEIHYGPMPINPSNLSFDENFETTKNTTAQAHYRGFWEINGQQFDFDYEFNPQLQFDPNGLGVWIDGQYDDAGYPGQLGLTIDFESGVDSEYEIKIFGTYVDGVLLEVFYRNSYYNYADGTWQGTLVPEPATLLLLGLGVVLLRKKR